jgi:hypothetical protein
VFAAGVRDIGGPDRPAGLGDISDTVAVRVVDVVAKRKCAVGDDGNLVDAPFGALTGGQRWRRCG